MDILFKPPVKATEQMTQNWTFHYPRINKSTKLHLSDMYVVVISCFHSTSHLKTQVEGTYMYTLNLLLLHFIDICENVTKCSSENI